MQEFFRKLWESLKKSVYQLSLLMFGERLEFIFSWGAFTANLALKWTSYISTLTNLIKNTRFCILFSMRDLSKSPQKTRMNIRLINLVKSTWFPITKELIFLEGKWNTKHLTFYKTISIKSQPYPILISFI